MHVHTEQYTPSVTCLPAREDNIIREVEEDGDLSAEIHKVLTAIEQLLKKAEPLKAAKAHGQQIASVPPAVIPSFRNEKE